MRVTFAAAVLLTALLAIIASASAAQPSVRTLVSVQGRTQVSVQGRITAFGEDGRFIAWAATGRSCGEAVRLYDVARRRTTVLTRPGTPGCRMTASVAQLAVAGTGS